MNVSRKSIWFLALVPALVLAQAAQKIEWRDLAPKQTPYTNPFDKLNNNDFLDMVTVARVHDIQKAGDKPSAQQVTAANKARANLKKRKIDVDKLLAERDQIMVRRKRELTEVTASLNGKMIEMSGYLLPLEFDGERVTEFLLVPWVGACIHTPPPAPNQIVFVHGAKPIINPDKFEAVTVTGRLTGKSMEKELFLVDGSSQISVGYSLQATNVAIKN